MGQFYKIISKVFWAVAVPAFFAAGCAGDDYLVSGTVKDNSGKPVAGVVVSDGYACVQTNGRGKYSFVRDTAAKYVYISTPSGYETAGQDVSGSFPDFFKPAFPREGNRAGRYKVDFELIPVDQAGKKILLFGVGDPQSNHDGHIERFRTQTIPDMRETWKGYGDAVYPVAVMLGDIIGIGEPASYFKQKAAFGEAGFPCLPTVGNHDKDAVDWTGEAYSEAFGPRWYSYNVGDIHFVSMDNIHEFSGKEKGAKLTVVGFSDEQLRWLEQDLGFVPKDKKVVIFYHVPERAYANHLNHDEVFSLVSEYSDPMAICGHTHFFEFFNGNGFGIDEYILGAACGYFWRSDCGVDGVPNGYAVFEIDGTEITDAYFKGTDRPRDYQMRLYRGNEKFGGPRAMYEYGLGSDVVVANVFFAGMGGDWKIEVYEDGELSGEMERMDHKVTDLWARGYHTGVENFPLASSNGPNYHQFKYKLKNPQARVLVKAVDPWGNSYVQEKFWSNGDFADIDGSFRKN